MPRFVEDRPTFCAPGRVIGLNPELILLMTFALRLAATLSPILESTLAVRLIAFLSPTLESILVVRLVVSLGPTLGSGLAGSLVVTLARVSGDQVGGEHSLAAWQGVQANAGRGSRLKSAALMLSAMGALEAPDVGGLCESDEAASRHRSGPPSRPDRRPASASRANSRSPPA